jgi:hypothetical protein
MRPPRVANRPTRRRPERAVDAAADEGTGHPFEGLRISISLPAVADAEDAHGVLFQITGNRGQPCPFSTPACSSCRSPRKPITILSFDLDGHTRRGLAGKVPYGSVIGTIPTFGVAGGIAYRAFDFIVGHDGQIELIPYSALSRLCLSSPADQGSGAKMFFTDCGRGSPVKAAKERR